MRMRSKFADSNQKKKKKPERNQKSNLKQYGDNVKVANSEGQEGSVESPKNETKEVISAEHSESQKGTKIFPCLLLKKFEILINMKNLGEEPGSPSEERILECTENSSQYTVETIPQSPDDQSLVADANENNIQDAGCPENSTGCHY